MKFNYLFVRIFYSRSREAEKKAVKLGEILMISRKVEPQESRCTKILSKRYSGSGRQIIKMKQRSTKLYWQRSRLSDSESKNQIAKEADNKIIKEAEMQRWYSREKDHQIIKEAEKQIIEEADIHNSF